MRRRRFLGLGLRGGLAAALGGCAFRGSNARRRARKPNVVLILADDLGFADVGFEGDLHDIPTPHIDGLAASGVRFTHGYVSASVCSPTRAGLLTGRYQQRFGHEGNIPERGYPQRPLRPDAGMPTDPMTLPQMLEPAGYVSTMLGKWHLGTAERYRPTQRGFDEALGFMNGAHSYTDDGRRARKRTYDISPIYRNGRVDGFDGYLTDVLTDEAIGFVERHRTGPFFLYLAYNAPHSPFQALERDLERVAHIADPVRRKYAAMVVAIDRGVGRLLGALRTHGLEKDTLVFFLSDNGGARRGSNASNAPLRGCKGQLWEGGIHVPFAVRWPGRLPSGKVVHDPVISLDITATIVAQAGGRTPNQSLDGVDLVPYLTGEKAGKPHDTLYWREQATWAIRHGDYKLVKEDEADQPQLFNLIEDIGETRDLVAAEPAKARELQRLFNAWDKQLPKPLWWPAKPLVRLPDAGVEHGP